MTARQLISQSAFNDIMGAHAAFWTFPGNARDRLSFTGHAARWPLWMVA